MKKISDLMIKIRKEGVRMVKHDLRENGFSAEERITKKFISTLLWVAIAVLIIAGTFVMVMTVVGWITPYEGAGEVRNPIDFDLAPGSIPLGLLAFVLMLLFYFGIRFVLTFLFCHDRYNSIRLTILDDNHLPVCQCREALKVWQTVLIYLVPVVVVYVLMLRMTGFWFPLENIEYINFGFLTMLFFMTFFLAFDLTLVVYVLFIKIKDKADYIAIDHHVYKMTVYKETYVRRSGKKVKKQLKTSEVIKPESRKKMFVTMTTCLNPECENYAIELDKSVKTCPLCEAKIYKAEILQNVVTCLNEDCENYGQELKEEITECELCYGKTGRLSFKFVPHLALPSFAVSVLSAVLFTWIFWLFDEKGIQGLWVDIAGGLWFVCWLTSVIMGFLSKKKLTIAVAVLSYYASYIVLQIIT